MDSLKQGYAAAVFGAQGGIGGALARQLADDPRSGAVYAISRGGGEVAGCVPLSADLTDETSLGAVAQEAAKGPPLALVVLATGHLHGPEGGPEKTLRQLAPGPLATAFAVNAIGPALAAKHLLPVMARGRGMFAALSARVGSISDNRAGGWYGYRASKAALNQMLKCLAIETGRRHPERIVAGLQPGTVATDLSAPFRGAATDVFTPEAAARHLLRVLDGLRPEQSGRVFDWSGREVPP